MEREFVQFNVAAFSGQRIGIGRKAIDAAAIGELQHISGVVVFPVEDDLAEVNGSQVEEPSPILAILQIEFGLGLVTGGNPDIELGTLGAGFENRIVSIGVGDPSLASLLDYFEEGVVGNPFGLVAEKIFSVPPKIF